MWTLVSPPHSKTSPLLLNLRILITSTMMLASKTSSLIMRKYYLLPVRVLLMIHKSPVRARVLPPAAQIRQRNFARGVYSLLKERQKQPPSALVIQLVSAKTHSKRRSKIHLCGVAGRRQGGKELRNMPLTPAASRWRGVGSRYWSRRRSPS